LNSIENCVQEKYFEVGHNFSSTIFLYSIHNELTAAERAPIKSNPCTDNRHRFAFAQRFHQDVIHFKSRAWWRSDAHTMSDILVLYDSLS
jgi:hypothetical protein